MSEQHLTNQTFGDLGLDSKVLQGIEEAGFSFCTPIQAQTLPLALKGQDVAGQAQTGTGKTAAFLLATMQHLLRHQTDKPQSKRQPRALILAPTRELAIQIHKDALVFGRHVALDLGLAYGGTGYEQQRRTIVQGVDILIGTPGRIIDYFKQGVFNLKEIQALVLDEADRMFDLGFIKDIRYLLRRMPPPQQRLNLLFSATLSLRVNELAYEHMNNPKLVEIKADNVTADKITQRVYYVANEEKIPLLLGLMKQMNPLRTLVFVNTKDVAEEVTAYLEGNDFTTGVLSGDVPQKKRQRLLAQFQDGEISILVATDVAARGLHIPAVSHVFNYDLPQDPEDYVHRVGRTARLGATGDAISFACESYAYSLPDIEEYIGDTIVSAKVSAELLVEPKPKRVHKRSAKPRNFRGNNRGDKAFRKKRPSSRSKT